MADDAKDEHAVDDLLGSTLGNCVIEGLLGEGGMARVYRAHQPHLERDVAIKVLPQYYAADPEFVERFKREARAMARLKHPNIVTVHDTGEDRGRLYIIMEYVGGGNLRQRIATGLSLAETTQIVRQVASALAYAHTNGVIHRDVKPMNVLMDTHGRAVLSDFGIAKVMENTGSLTKVGAGVGTPEYMSPEQCSGATADARSDIYSLGVMLYEMLTGRTPFVADNYTALAHMHIYEPVPPPSKVNPRISPAVQAVVLMALEKDPSRRFQKATDMAVALEQAVAAQMPVGRETGRAPVPGYAPAPAAVSVCPRCQTHNAPGTRFCTACGQALVGQQPVRPSAAPVSGGAGWVACPTCQAPNQPNNRFCTRCGASLAALAITCRTCHSRNAPGTRFCTTCGQPLG